MEGQPLSLHYWRSQVLGVNHTDTEAAFAEWFGLKPIEAKILDAIWSASAPIRGKTIAFRLGKSWGHVLNCVATLHDALPGGIESSRYDGYRLTDHGREECRKALEVICG